MEVVEEGQGKGRERKKVMVFETKEIIIIKNKK